MAKMDDAVKKVNDKLILRNSKFSNRLSQELQGYEYGKRSEVAKAIKSAPSTVTSWETFTPKNFIKLRDLCKALDLDANYLLGLSDERKSLYEVNNLGSISCPYCGTTELLCGHNGVGCTSEN